SATGGDCCLRQGGPPTSEGRVDLGWSFSCRGWPRGILAPHRRIDASTLPRPRGVGGSSGPLVRLSEWIARLLRSGGGNPHSAPPPHPGDEWLRQGLYPPSERFARQRQDQRLPTIAGP